MESNLKDLLVSFQFIGVHFAFFVVVDVLGHLPHLHYVVFRDRTNYPGLIGIPRKVRYLSSMATMDKLKLKEKIFFQI